VGAREEAGDGVICKLIDFGSAVALRDVNCRSLEDESLMTINPGDFVGTPAYAAPESFIDPDSVGRASDIWSLAASLFHLASGRLPFPCSSPLEATLAIAGDMNQPPPDVRDAAPDELRASISGAFAEALKVGLQKDRAKRYESADDFASALHACLVDLGEGEYSVFISYRSASEKYHAEMLYQVNWTDILSFNSGNACESVCQWP